MAWVRCCGSKGNALSYPLNVFNLIWSAKSASIPNENRSAYCYLLDNVPQITAGLTLTYTGTQTQGAAQANRTYIQASTDGTTWSTIVSSGGETSVALTASLNNYAGQQIYLRVWFYNGGATTHNFAMTSMTIA